MEVFLIHLIKSSALLSIFYLAYYFLLKKDTSFQKNRLFLLAGIFSAAILPFVHFTQVVIVDTVRSSNKLLNSNKVEMESLPEIEFDLWQITGIIYIIVTVWLISKFLIQVATVAKLARSQGNRKEGAFLYIQTNTRTSPFSFFNLIVFNPATHPKEELKMVLEHERVHSRQFHTFDILLANLAAAFLWFNPLSWSYRKSVEENLEYIADRETIKIIGKQKEYQYALLRVSQKGHFSRLLNHFHHSFIRNRIIMLKKNTTTKGYWGKHFLVLPAVIFFLLGFNTKEEIKFSNREEITNSYSEIGQEPIFFIDSNTSDAYFRGMESYFRQNYPGFQIAFTGVTRGADLAVTGFQIETKFEGEEHFTKRMENFGEHVLKPRFAVQYSSEKEALIIKEQYEKELQITITKEAIHASHIEESSDEKLNSR